MMRKRRGSRGFTDGAFHTLLELASLFADLRHIDAALYDLSPPKVTSLYAVSVPKGEPQLCRYDDGTGDELKVPLGGTACKFAVVLVTSCLADDQSSAERQCLIFSPPS